MTLDAPAAGLPAVHVRLPGAVWPVSDPLASAGPGSPPIVENSPQEIAPHVAVLTLQLKHLRSLRVNAPELPERLRKIHRTTRRLLGKDLCCATPSLSTLMWLEQAIGQQLEEGQVLRARLIAANTDPAVIREVEALCEFLERALPGIEQQVLQNTWSAGAFAQGGQTSRATARWWIVPVVLLGLGLLWWTLRELLMLVL